MMLERKDRIVLWLVPLLLIVHNGEEAFTMPQWVAEHLLLLQSKFFFFKDVSFSSPQILLSLLLLSIIPVIIAWVCTRGPFTSLKIRTMLLMQIVVGWNAVVPHLAGTAILGMYNPGAWTAALINIPFTVFLVRHALQRQWITAADIRRLTFIAVGIYLPIIYGNHLVAQLISGVLQ